MLLVTALRAIIGFAFVRTRSLLLAQLIHISSTGSLVMFGPNRVTPAQEAVWYAAYGALLSIAAVLLWGRAAAAPSLRRSSA